ncbi:hypothetical protein SAMN06265346_11724 [Flavobacterium hercynium]|uniref:DUF805 domain-containing protein n=1 Tax=Flavobacterium hercynium TaxID=387094 RepID=A0A226GV71_9FLAO|nr:hypothetical protein B0A66_18690 [Flavobacterium hercynium]SMP33716.1 hypothetical protein SAMN06265346_11724 [Flavobacterium hercynium]
MLKEYLDKYVLVWKSIFNLNESMSRKDFWQFVLFNYLCYFVVSYLFSFWTYYFFNLLFLVFIISLILTGIKRLNDIHLPWPYLFFPFYNLYLLVQKGDDNLGGGKPVKEKAHLSFKSLGIAFVFSVVIFNAVFSGSPAGFFSIIDVFVFVGFAVVLFMICFVIIRLIAYSIVYEKIYPNLVFQILLPFFFIVSAAFIIYVIYYLNFSEGIYDFEEIIKHFATGIVSYIAIFTIITGVIFSSEIQKKEITKNELMNKNIQLLVAMTILIAIVAYLFYRQYKMQ